MPSSSQSTSLSPSSPPKFDDDLECVRTWSPPKPTCAFGGICDRDGPARFAEVVADAETDEFWGIRLLSDLSSCQSARFSSRSPDRRRTTSPGSSTRFLSLGSGSKALRLIASSRSGRPRRNFGWENSQVWEVEDVRCARGVYCDGNRDMHYVLGVHVCVHICAYTQGKTAKSGFEDMAHEI